jgi:signal transduction histidine kinase
MNQMIRGYDLAEIERLHPQAMRLSDAHLIELLTERMRSRQGYLTQLAKTYHTLEETHQKLVRTELVQGRFLALMHDRLKDNLENMRVLLSALTLAKLYDEDIQLLFELMFNDVLSLQFHANNISMASNIDSGRVSANISMFTLGSLLEPLESSLCHLIDQSNKRCEWLIDESLTIYQDQEKLLLILRNVLSNALRFTPDNGEISFSVRALDETHLEIVVRNQGADIVDKEVIFDVFYQVDLSYGRAQHGLGLGLSVVKGLVSFMNGEIEMTRVGDANQLYIILPVLRDTTENFERFSVDRKEDFVFADESDWSASAAF